MKDKIYKFFTIVGEYALYGLLFFIPISNSLIQIFAGLMLFGFIGRKVIKPDFEFLKFWPNIFLPLFLFFSVVSMLNSGIYLDRSLHALFGKWIPYIGICFIIQDNIHGEKVFKYAMSALLFSAALVILSALSQYFLGVEFLRNKNMIDMNWGTHAVSSSFSHNNSLGVYLVMVLPIVFVLLAFNGSVGFKTIGLSILSAFLIMVIVLTFSRGSWIALAISFIFVCCFSAKNLKWLIPVFFITLLVFFFLLARERLFLVFKYGWDSDRLRYWTTAWNMINAHPFFGVGLGTFMANFSKYIPPTLAVRPAYAHNCYLQIWAESGIFSLFSFMLFMITMITLGIKAFFGSKDYLLLGLLAGILGFLAHSFFDTDLYSLQLAYLFWVWVGLIVVRLKTVYK